jgi:hypothetical protein
MTATGACGRADLVRALASGDADTVAAVAELLGFMRRHGAAVEVPTGRIDIAAHAPEITAGDESPAKEFSKPLIEVPFWVTERFEVVTETELQETPVEDVDVTWDTRPTQTPPIRLLAPWRELQPHLRKEATELRETKEVDIPAIVRRLSEGALLDRVPRERRRRWGPRLQIILDRSDRLVPYWADQDLVAGALARLVPEHTLELALFWEDLREPRLAGEGQTLGPYRLPPPGSLILVLGDLGCLAADDPLAARPWRDLGRRLAEGGCRAVALIPGPSSRFDRTLAQHWQMIPWGRSRGPAIADPVQLRRRAERLLRLVSPAVRIEPGFLRAVRLLLPPEEADAATEADAWQHPAVTSKSL